MKKVLYFFAAIIVATSLVFYGCNEQESNSIILPRVENPFNFVGEMHNVGLDAVLGAIPDTKSSQITLEEIEKLTNDFCESVFSNDSRFFVNPLTKAGDTTAAETEYTTISNEANAYLDRIISVTSTDDYEYIKKQLAMFEEDLLLNKASTFSDLENTLLLCTIAVGKYSNEYWKEYTAAKTRGLFASIIAGDAIGAAKGIAKNALIIVVSSVGGPGSVLATAGRSALGPAIAGSAEAALLYGVAQL